MSFITTVISTTCVVGIPWFMIEEPIKNGIPTTIILLKKKMPILYFNHKQWNTVVSCCRYTLYYGEDTLLKPIHELTFAVLCSFVFYHKMI